MLNARTLITSGLVALTIAGTTIATTSDADARNRFWPGFAAGAVGGALVTGALTAPAYAAPVYRAPVYGPTYYSAYPAYDEPVIVDAPHCTYGWRRDIWGNHYRVRACS